ncbi:sodium:phosphate symporter [Rhizobium sp. Leaf371]|uniref:Na/Pi cotransporter family protein n=1 Tax=Rhizobium sp. Leaf371 TaxID=1736355 RepID=UPI000713A07B|nr:Na/Pi cotransporter family protein [Rhizobium sp. Leaf371]KQS69294.1 sodium:phosphate symporter [Rhizobium sp. Leaf371]
MTSTVIMINLFGAVALLMFGLAQVKDGVTRAFGARLRTGLAAGTKRGWRSFLSGFVATVALQSSTATALMVSSFVERGMIKPRMAQIALLGANIGTAVTAWIVSTGIEWLSPLLILIGIVLLRAASTARRGLGTALVGIGLMLLSLHLLGLATEPLRTSPALRAFIGLLDGAWPVALIFAAVLAFLSSSSLAIVVLILSLGSTGILSPGLMVVLVLGANLGGAVPPFMASLGAGPAARRVTLGNLIVRGCGCLIVLPMAGTIADGLSGLPLSAAKLPVDIHLLFNVLLGLAAWPLSRRLSAIMQHLVPDAPAGESGPRYLDAQEFSTPAIALTSATREVLGIGDLIERMLLLSLEAFRLHKAERLQPLPALEQVVDGLQQAVKVYLSRLAGQGLDDEGKRRSIMIIDYAINLEHIGDLIEKGLMAQVGRKIVEGMRLSDAGNNELLQLFEMTIENLRLAQTVFVTRDPGLARRMMEIKVEVRNMERRSAELHFQRLRDGQAESLQTSSLHLDMLRDLKRINAHITSVAHPIINASGLLRESRLRKSASSVAT